MTATGDPLTSRGVRRVTAPDNAGDPASLIVHLFLHHHFSPRLTSIFGARHVNRAVVSCAASWSASPISNSNTGNRHRVGLPRRNPTP